MTDIHKLHTEITEIIEKYQQEDARATWLNPILVMYREVAKILEQNQGQSLLYHFGCGPCAEIIRSFSVRNQHTIESLEKRIAELKIFETKNEN